MFSKAKRFDLEPKLESKETKVENVLAKPKVRPFITTPKITKTAPSLSSDQKSETSSVRSVKTNFATPKPTKPPVTRSLSSSKIPITSSASKSIKKLPSKPDVSRTREDLSKIPDVVAAQEIEIRNKDYTIAEYGQQIEELKNEIANLQNKIKEDTKTQKQECLEEIEKLNREIEKVNIEDENHMKAVLTSVDYEHIIIGLQGELQNLHNGISKLEEEVLDRQMELSSLENVITVRDSLCKDLQEKLTEKETALEELKQRLEMVNGHHALALEANESIRREYKQELECLKLKMDEEKQAIITKSKNDQDSLKSKYLDQMEKLKTAMEKQKHEAVQEVEQILRQKEAELKAKLEQIEERAHEKVRLCEIQFEQRNNGIQEHWQQQQDQIKLLELELGQIKYSLSMNNEQKINLKSELLKLRTERECLLEEKTKLTEKIENVEEFSKKKTIEYENERNKLVAEIEKIRKDKHKYETSLNVTREIVHVLSDRLRDSDNELDHLEQKLQNMTENKVLIQNELASYKTTLNNTLLECAEYKDALMKILNSKAALAMEHNKIMEHNVKLIDCLENVEKEAFREFGNIKDEMVGDVEMFKKDSIDQIRRLRNEVEKKHELLVLATQHAGHAQSAADQSHQLLQQAACELATLQAENAHLHQQIQDQQSLAVEVSLLRQENEELTMTIATQSSIIDKMKKDTETQQTIKSPSVQRKAFKMGKENAQILISPLRERNH